MKKIEHASLELKIDNLDELIKLLTQAQEHAEQLKRILKDISDFQLIAKS